MNNVLAIAHKELRAYFASPIAYIVIGFFTLLFGWFYIGILEWFVRQGLQGQMGMGASSMNVNQQMIRPLILNITVVFLFLLPLITMRTYAEEKRSGTIELLLTSPLTDLEIVLGKFVAAWGTALVFLALTLPLVAYAMTQGGVPLGRVLCSTASPRRVPVFWSSPTTPRWLSGPPASSGLPTGS